MIHSLEYPEISKVVKVSTGLVQNCSVCSEQLDASEDFAAVVNHYLLKHAWVLLHVGHETSHAEDGAGLWTDTIAVLGQK